ncbi:hypothetical protein GCM10027053_14920 [Intrasporangium mesophilum]
MRPVHDRLGSRTDDEGDTRDERRDWPALDLVLVAQVSVLLAAIIGPLPLLSVQVDRSQVRPRRGEAVGPVAIVEVRAHCSDDLVASEAAALLGLTASGTRTFPALYADVVFVESSWSGWLTPPEASRLAAPVAVTVLGSHDEPTRPSVLDSGASEADTAAVAPLGPEGVAS